MLFFLLKYLISRFLKVGNSPKDLATQPQGSWRQAILNSVVTPSKAADGEFMTPVKSSSEFAFLRMVIYWF